MSGSAPMTSSISRLEPLAERHDSAVEAKAGRKLAARLEPFDS
jgi:hypothetical protein